MRYGLALSNQRFRLWINTVYHALLALNWGKIGANSKPDPVRPTLLLVALLLAGCEAPTITLTLGWWFIPAAGTVGWCLLCAEENREASAYGVAGIGAMIAAVPMLLLWVAYLVARLWGLPA